MALSSCKKLFALLRGITSKTKGNFYCLNCLHSLRTKKKSKCHKKACKNKGFCNVIVPSEDTKILESDQYQKSSKETFIIYADLECLIENTDGCKKNRKNSCRTKVDYANEDKKRKAEKSLYRAKEITKKVYNNIMNLTKL